MKSEEKLKHLRDYINFRIEIIADNPDRWLGYRFKDHWYWNAHYSLPTFDEYLENCVINKGGPYDFTKRRYESLPVYCDPVTYCAHMHRNTGSKKIRRCVKYAMYMGTPFNFKEIVEYDK